MRHKNTPRPRFTGHGRPVFHDHGSRRAMLDRRLDDRTAIAEEVEGLADWERELLTSTENTVVSDTDVQRYLDGQGSWPEPSQVPGFDQARFARQEEERIKERQQARIRRDAWADKVAGRPTSADALRSLRVQLGVDAQAQVRPFVSSNHRVRVSDLGKRLGLDGVQTLHIVNGVFNEYAKTSASGIASVVASEILSWAKTPEGVTTIQMLHEEKRSHA